MLNVSMVVIERPAPGTRPVAQVQIFPPGPWLTGQGDINYLCGGCEQVIAEGLENASQITGLAIICPRCGECNETRG